MVIYSHSHIDHFGGVRGVVDEADVISGKVKIIAPDGFMEHAVAENVYAGNAMSRSAFYQYGLLIQRVADCFDISYLADERADLTNMA